MENTKKPIEKITNFLYEHRYFLFTIGFLIVMCLIPLELMATTRGHDNEFHLQRIKALADEIKAGNFFPRIYSTMLGGSGYATPLFYGDLFLTIPAGLIARSLLSLTDAYAFFVALIFAATVFSMYFSTYSITKSKKSAFCGAVMFGLSSYLVTDLIQRAALGEAQAFVFMPIVFAGFYHIFYGEIHKWYLLPIGLAGMIYCHTLSGLATVVVLFLLFLFSLQQVQENPFRLAYLGISVVLFLALSANFLFPMLEQLASGSFLATDGFSATRYGTLESRAMPWWSLFYDSATNNKVHGPYIPNGIGLAGLVLAAIYIFNRKKHKDGFVSKLLILSGFLLFATSGLFPWALFQKTFGLLQFPWRLLVYPTFFVALAAAIYFGKESEHSDSTPKGSLMCLVIALSLFSYANCLEPHFNEYWGYQHKHTEIEYPYKNYIGSAEYLPSSNEFVKDTSYVTQYRAAIIKSSNMIFSDGNPTVSALRDNGKLIVDFKNMDKDNAYLDVPLLMYKGYSAHLEDGTELECYYGKYNRIRVNVGNIREGTVIFEYTGTTVQKVSGIVSVVALIGTVAYLVIFPILRKKKETEPALPEESSQITEE